MKKKVKTKEDIPDWQREGFNSYEEWRYEEFLEMSRKANGIARDRMINIEERRKY